MQRTAMRPSEVYRLLKTIPVEAMVLLVAKGMMTKGPGRSLLTGRLSRFLKQDRQQTTLLKGTDLIRIGLKPGPKFKTILDRLLDARLNGHVRTKSEEQALVHRLARLPA
jgi:tRNA nucleotidyltransferase (CCA-adding enzyme)